MAYRRTPAVEARLERTRASILRAARLRIAADAAPRRRHRDGRRRCRRHRRHGVPVLRRARTASSARSSTTCAAGRSRSSRRWLPNRSATPIELVAAVTAFARRAVASGRDRLRGHRRTGTARGRTTTASVTGRISPPCSAASSPTASPPVSSRSSPPRSRRPRSSAPCPRSSSDRCRPPAPTGSTSRSSRTST